MDPTEWALQMKLGCTMPEHMTLTMRTLGGYWNLDTPARSAPAYEHHLQQNATMRGSKSSDSSWYSLGSDAVLPWAIIWS
jgi:hypothetical protein